MGKPRTRVTVKRQEDIWPDTQQLLDNIRKHKYPYFVNFEGLTLRVNPGVFPPTTETHLLISHLPRDLTGKCFLDLTTGTGVAAIFAGQRNGTGLAVDINPYAVSNVKQNLQRFGLSQQVRVLQSDLFSGISREVKKDLILITPPYYDSPEMKPRDFLEYAVIGGRQFVSRFFEEVDDYITPNGVIFMTYAEWAGKKAVDFLERTAHQNGYLPTVIGKKANKEGTHVYRLYEITRKIHL